MRRRVKGSRIAYKYTVVDVGAGLRRRYKDWLIEMPGLVIHAIEPHPELAAELRALAADLEADDGTSGERLRVYEFAATEEDGPCKFYLTNDRSSSSTLPLVEANLRKWRYPLGRRFFKTVGEIEVQGKTLHTFCKEHSVRLIDFLNVDVQGNALGVLNGWKTAADWDRAREMNIKVHTIDWELYAGQTVNYYVLDLCRRKYFSLDNKTPRTRGQEDVMSFLNDLAVMKGWPVKGWCKKALMPLP